MREPMISDPFGGEHRPRVLVCTGGMNTLYVQLPGGNYPFLPQHVAFRKEDMVGLARIAQLPNVGVCVIRSNSGEGRKMHTREQAEAFVQHLVTHGHSLGGPEQLPFYVCPHDPDKEECQCRPGKGHLLFETWTEAHGQPETVIWADDKQSGCARVRAMNSAFDDLTAIDCQIRLVDLEAAGMVDELHAWDPMVPEERRFTSFAAFAAWICEGEGRQYIQ